jgi:hypothetical protein
VLGDRLWDDDGVEWSLSVRWADAKQTTQFLRRERSVALVGPGQGVTWLTAVDARSLWLGARRHFEVPGQSASAGPDQDGLTYGAKVWRHGSDRLLMIQTFC